MAGIGHSFLAGRCKSSLGGWVMLMVALMPPPPTVSKDRGSAFDYSPPFNDTRGIRWAFPVELESSPASFIVSLASSRLRYMLAPSPPLPLALEVGTEALAKVAYEKLDYVRSHFGSTLAACELANGELAACLRSTDRGIPSYQAFLKKCLTTIAPLPAASIPSRFLSLFFLRLLVPSTPRLFLSGLFFLRSLFSSHIDASRPSHNRLVYGTHDLKMRLQLLRARVY